MNATDIKNELEANGYVIGSQTLGGHAPTPIVSALGTLLAEGDRNKPVGIFGSYGWSGEAVDLLESKLNNGGFEFAFEPIKIKFTPNAQSLKMLEETVEKLEDGGLTLNETTDMYEQGMKLSQICTNILKSTEVKITEIQTKYSDEMSSSDQ